MARVFTITPGLENLGALKTGGQGSVYKGRRTGEVISAIKILPAPIYSESGDDKNYIAFQNEVAKLKRVNEILNPHVVKIISSGITDAGSFPFIEMEYIEGPDLEELLQPPHYPVFTLKEALKVAEQLANALAHCHSLGVRHGDIKSNNVKFNLHTSNYILLDFGLAVMSDEQRLSSFRHAGDIEFMAPEQNTGQMLFQTDVYGFGIILFELLSGTVPFKVKDKGESARNEVRLAHMVSPLPDLLELRRAALPGGWSQQTKENEMQVPQWLVKLIYKCLEKKPEKRFANGMELHAYIVRQLISGTDDSGVNQITLLKNARQDLVVNQEQLQKQLSQYREELLKKENECITLQHLLHAKETAFTANVSAAKAIHTASHKGVSRTSFMVLLLLTLGLGVFAALSLFKSSPFVSSEIAGKFFKQINTSSDTDTVASAPVNEGENDRVEEPAQVEPAPESDTPDNTPVDKPADSSKQQQTQAGNQQSEQSDRKNEQGNQQYEQSNRKKEPEKVEQKTMEPPANEKPLQQKNEKEEQAAKPVSSPDENKTTIKRIEKPIPEDDDNTGNRVSKKYLVVSKAYFYNDPDENTRRDEFISPLEHAVVLSLNERYDFIYVIISNPQGQIFKGWLRKRDLKLYSID